MLHTLELFVSCSASLYFGCATHVYVVQRCCNYDVRHVRFQARAYEFLDKVIEFCMTRCCGAFGSFIVCGVQRVCQSYDGQCSRRIRYRRVWSFIIHKRQFVFLCYVAGAYCWSTLVDISTSSSNSLLGALWTVQHQGDHWRKLVIADLYGDRPLRIQCCCMWYIYGYERFPPLVAMDIGGDPGMDMKVRLRFK